MIRNKSNASLRLPFTAAATSVDLSKSKDTGVGLYVYTEMQGVPVVNYCDQCNRPYYIIQNVNNNQIMATQVRVSRCRHSAAVVPYLRSADVVNM